MAILSTSYHTPLVDYRGPLPIVARFDRTLHLLAPDGCISTVSRAGTDGPLRCAVPWPSWPLFNRARFVRFETAGSAHGSTALDHATIVIRLDKTAAWDPSSDPIAWRPGTLLTGLLALEIGTVGSAFFHAGAMGTALMSSRSGTLDAIRNLQADRVEESASRLVGLGPGLTPSGADWLAGLTFALTRLSNPRRHAGHARQALAAVMAPRVLTSTTRLSRTLLCFAAQGVVSAEVDDLLCTIAAGGRALEQKTERVTAIGHTSGSDMTLGLADGIRLVLRSPAWA